MDLSLSIQPFLVELLKERISARLITGEDYNTGGPVLQLLELIRKTFVTMAPAGIENGLQRGSVNKRPTTFNCSNARCDFLGYFFNVYIP